MILGENYKSVALSYSEDEGSNAALQLFIAARLTQKGLTKENVILER